MADDLKRVGLVFTADGAIDFKKSLSEVNSSIKENYSEFKLAQSQWDKNTTSLEKLRTKQEFLEGHLDGAILIPYYEISKKIENILQNKEQTIIVYCLNGGRSIKAGEELKELGYKNIYNLKDGMEGIL